MSLNESGFWECRQKGAGRGGGKKGEGGTYYILIKRREMTQREKQAN